MRLSVLSALARAGVDPWEEAAHLARLPGETATQRLASLIAALPNGSTSGSRPRADCRSFDRAPAAPSWFQSLVAQDLVRCRCGDRFPIGNIYDFYHVIFIAVVLGAQWIVASRQPEARVDTAQAPTSSRAIPQTLPPSSGQ
jgi:hypothetical protein